jgi:hypothetical protein
MKSKICRRRATSWCGRTCLSATRIKVRDCLVGYPLVVPWRSLTRFSLLIAELDSHVDQLKASETDLKNFFYQDQEAREVL